MRKYKQNKDRKIINLKKKKIIGGLIGVKERKKKEEKKYTEKLKNVTIDMIRILHSIERLLKGLGPHTMMEV